MFLGYLIPEKGVDVLLESALRLSADIPVRVTLIGQVAPGFRATLERYRDLQSERFTVVATGRLEFEDLLAELRRQHAFVFLSRFEGEGHPNAVNEAMAVGLPVIASRQGFLADVVDETCGVLIDDPQDVTAVSAVLAGLYRDWDRLRTLASGARKRLTDHFSEGVVLERTAGVYDACVRGAK